MNKLIILLTLFSCSACLSADIVIDKDIRYEKNEYKNGRLVERSYYYPICATRDQSSFTREPVITRIKYKKSGSQVAYYETINVRKK